MGVGCGLFLCPPALRVPRQMLTSFAMGDDCDAEGLAARAALCLIAVLPTVKHLTEVALQRHCGYQGSSD